MWWWVSRFKSDDGGYVGDGLPVDNFSVCRFAYMDLFIEQVCFNFFIDQSNCMADNFAHFRRPYGDKSETTPFLNSSASTASPTGPILSGNSTINRTLLHHQQNQGSSLAVSNVGRNGTTQLRGLAYNGESPPPDYNIVVHDTRHGFFIFIFSFLYFF